MSSESFLVPFPASAAASSKETKSFLGSYQPKPQAATSPPPPAATAAPAQSTMTMTAPPPPLNVASHSSSPSPSHAASGAAFVDSQADVDEEFDDDDMHEEDEELLSADNSQPGSPIAGSTPPSLSNSSSMNSLSLARDSIPSDPSYRLPLHQPWSLHWNPDKPDAKGWDFHVRKVVDIASVEEFWGAFNQFAKPSHLPQKFDLHFFVKGVKPAWEDPANKKGGKWVMEYKKSEDEQYNTAWLNSCLALIGEQFSDLGQVMGCVVGSRKGKSRISLWTKSSSDGDLVKRIGREWKSLINLDAKSRIGFSTHEEAMNGKMAHETTAKYEV